MYMPEKPHQTTSPPPQPLTPPPTPLEPLVMNYYSEAEEDATAEEEQELNHQGHDMMVEVSTTHPPLHHHHLGGDTSTSGGGEGSPTTNNIISCSSDLEAPKMWVLEETHSLLTLRGEIDSLINTSKSNKHLWDQISMKMREKGFDRSPNMCNEKWRQLLKEFKKAKHSQDPNGCSKMSYYNEIEEILRDGSSNGATYKNPSASEVDPFLQFSDKGHDETSITFGPVEANGRSTLNLESSLDHNGHPLAIPGTDAVAAGVVSTWNWRETNGNGEQTSSFGGRVISIKWEGYTKRIGIDGAPDAIKETIKTAFRLRMGRLFWLEDEDNIARTIDRDMPLRNYTLHLDEGLTIKVCLDEDPDHLTEDKTFFSEEAFHKFLSRRGWTRLREYNGYRNIDSIHELFPGGIYRGVN